MNKAIMTFALLITTNTAITTNIASRHCAGDWISTHGVRTRRPWKDMWCDKNCELSTQPGIWCQHNCKCVPSPTASLTTASPPIASPPIASPPIASPPIASPPIASPTTASTVSCVSISRRSSHGWCAANCYTHGTGELHPACDPSNRKDEWLCNCQ